MRQAKACGPMRQILCNGFGNDSARYSLDTAGLKNERSFFIDILHVFTYGLLR
jgi:hypothetical protein